MIFFRNEKVYVSKSDINFIKKLEDISLPSKRVLDNDDKLSDDMFIYKDETTIKFFRNLDFLVDFDVYKYLSIDDLENQKKILKTYINNIEDNLKVRKLVHLYNSLEEMIAVNKGYLELIEPVDRVSYCENLRKTKKLKIDFGIRDIKVKFDDK